MAIRIADIPRETLIHDYLQEGFSLRRHWEKLQKTKSDESQPLYCDYDLSAYQIDFDRLNLEIAEIYKKYQFQGWAKPGKKGYDPTYGGLALTENDNPKLSWKRGLLGHEKAMEKSFNFSRWRDLVDSKNHFQFLKSTLSENVRGSYYDSFSFHIPTIAAKYPEIQKVIRMFKKPFFRSRIATITKGHHVKAEEGWHRDERLFLFYRVIIPVQTSEKCRIKVQRTENGEKACEFAPQIGKAYTFNTRYPHAAFNLEACDFDRHYLVFCFSPWMEFDPVTKSFELNDHAGLTHPFELFLHDTFSAA